MSQSQSSTAFKAKGNSWRTQAPSAPLAQRSLRSSSPLTQRSQRSSSPLSRSQRSLRDVKTVVAGAPVVLAATSESATPFYKRVVEAERSRRAESASGVVVVKANRDDLLLKRERSLNQSLQEVTRGLIERWAERYTETLSPIVSEIYEIITSLIMGQRLWKHSPEEVVDKIITALFYSSSSGTNQLISSGTTPYPQSERGYVDFSLTGEITEDVVDAVHAVQDKYKDPIDGILDRPLNQLYSLVFSVVNDERKAWEERNPQEYEEQLAKEEEDEFEPVELGLYSENF